ncbi:putative ubiquitin-conjugating enzyme/RWD, steadiness box (SB) domain-containing protein [Lupinus albus]|uniref:Putative ubiquitin-conjugating enzyme/RWD, steadiness box (SB) domain-containing protein n=1 Tax=Lupinus albus TaxID=3870 RepID=A0A6A4NVT1_LUPAL|nr:putative ubiquitin-conjugating enzyme/RWD, steadiness box (SB) domain-containing protein [Lupinus albus]
MVPPAIESSNHQQFLSSVLSQRGPSALPYSEDAKWLIRQHLVSLTTTFPSLEPKTATFTHNDGRSVNLLQADGTVPMPYQGVTYNIPVLIWLMESYPRHPPCVYVNPTRDMVIKRPHAHVNPSGLVSVPYLHNWIYPSSNLVDLVRTLSHAFASDPPLYSQRRAPPPPSPSSHNPNPNFPTSSNLTSFPSGSSNLGAFSSGYSRPSIHPNTYPPSPYGSGSGSGSGSGRVQPSPLPHTEDPTEVFKRNAINKLVEMVHGDVVGLRKTKEAEIEGFFSMQPVLKQREDQLNKALKEMQDEMEGLEQKLQIILMNSDVLEGWLRDNQGKKLGTLENAEDAFECVDVLSKQMLDCTASDLATEDTLYALDKAVQVGSVPFDQYLRSVRALSREQFFHRATAAKVRAAQLQAQVANMASRNQHYAV